MQKISILFMLLFSCQILCSQSVGNGDIIHLKNGNKISGTILKQEFGVVSLKVTDSLTRKERVIQIQQYEISKIIKGEQSSSPQPDLKEGDLNVQKARRQSLPDRNVLKEQVGNTLQPEQVQQKMVLQPVPQPDTPIALPDLPSSVTFAPGQSTGTEQEFDPYSVPRPKRQARLWNRDIRGFRGFIDYAYIHGIGDAKNHRLEYGTSLGFQFNPIFYTGIGLSHALTLNDKDSSLPVYINQRINFIDDNTTPFLDVKVGYSVAAGKGFYFSVGSGVSFTRKGKNAFNLGLVYSLQNARFYDWSSENQSKRVSFNETYHGIALKLSFEFKIGR